MSVELLKLSALFSIMLFLATTWILRQISPDERSLITWRMTAAIVTAAFLFSFAVPAEGASFWMAASNTCSTIAPIYIYYASCDLFRQQRGRSLYWLWIPVAAYALYFSLVNNQPEWRMLQSGLTGLFFLPAARAFWRQRHQETWYAIAPTAAFFTIYGVMRVARFGFAPFSDLSSNLQETSNPVIPALLVTSAVSFGWLSLALTLIVGNRVRAELTEARDIAEEANSRLVELSWTDRLTGVASRARISGLLENEISMSAMNFNGTCAILVRSDRSSEQPNAEREDATMITISEVLTSGLPAGTSRLDNLGRWGHGEFLILLPDVDVDQSLALANHLHDRISEELAEGSAFRVGVTSLRTNDTNATVIARLEQALSRAGKGGQPVQCV